VTLTLLTVEQTNKEDRVLCLCLFDFLTFLSFVQCFPVFVLHFGSRFRFQKGRDSFVYVIKNDGMMTLSLPAHHVI